MAVTIIFVVGTMAALAAGGGVLARARRPRPKPLLLFRCPACGQKLRCLASEAGRPGMCPRCRERWTLPAESRDVTTQTSSCGSYRIGRTPVIRSVEQ